MWNYTRLRKALYYGVLVLGIAVVGFLSYPANASDFYDGEFEGRMGWIPDSNESGEYYGGYAYGSSEERWEEADRHERFYGDEERDALADEIAERLDR